MARAIKLELGSVVCWRNRFVWNGVNIYDRCWMLRLRKMTSPDFKHTITSLENILNLSTFTRRQSLFDLSFLFKPKPYLVILLIFCSRLSFVSLKRFLKIISRGCSGFVLTISVIILELIFNVWPRALALEYKTEKPSEGGSYTVAHLHPETWRINRGNHSTTNMPLIYERQCISIHCN